MNDGGASGTNQNDFGFALFAVLSFMLLAAAVVTPFLTNARTDALIARNVTNEIGNGMLADGLIALAANQIWKKIHLPGFTIPKSLKCQLGPTTIKFDLQNHAGLIDLNAASADLLKVGFLASGYAADISEDLAQTALRYRSVEQLQGPASLVEVAGGLKGGLFEAVDELNDFRVRQTKLRPDYRSIFTTRTATGTILDTALPSATQLVLKDMPASNIYFVVSGSPPLVAMTLTVALSRHGKFQFGASTEFGRNSVAEFGRLSPLRVFDKQVEVEADAVSTELSNCSSLIDQDALSAMRVLLVGETRQ
jgi:general secretion pathway protein K